MLCRSFVFPLTYRVHKINYTRRKVVCEFNELKTLDFQGLEIFQNSQTTFRWV